MSDSEPKPACEPDVPGLLATHGGWLRSVIVARLGDPGGADDVLQEVHVAAIEQKAPLRQRSAAVSWLYQLAVRQSMLFRRGMGRHRRRMNEAAAREETKHIEDTDPLEWLLSAERRELIRAALQQLDGEQRELLILKYVEGWSYRQIAERTGRTERAVESHLHRTRLRLRELLTRLNVIEQ